MGAEALPASLVLVSNHPVAADHLPLLVPAAAEVEQPIWLTDELLFSFQRCNRKAFLEVYGDRVLRDPPSDYLLKLRHDSLAHQSEVLAEQRRDMLALGRER